MPVAAASLTVNTHILTKVFVEKNYEHQQWQIVDNLMTSPLPSTLVFSLLLLTHLSALL